ncbi:MAG: ArsR family transcriptional regulator [Promethearchaeota archaeon]
MEANLNSLYKNYSLKLKIQILLFLRKKRKINKWAFFSELLINLNKSKSLISRTLRTLKEDGLILKEYEWTKNVKESHLKITLTEKGFNLVNFILKIALTQEEIELLKI